MQCKKALESSGGAFEAAIQFLREHASVSAGKKANRTLGAGTVANYTHDGVIGAIVLLACETDFVAKNPEFATLARDIAMQVAAMDPGSPEDLLAEPFIKDGGRTVHDLLGEAVQKFGERIEIGSYARLAVR